MSLLHVLPLRLRLFHFTVEGFQLDLVDGGIVVTQEVRSEVRHSSPSYFDQPTCT
jgi:hypothetical protein